MTRVKDCFVCRVDLRTREARRVEVTGPDGKGEVTRYCQGCWGRVRAALRKHVARSALTYQAHLRIWRY